jgi:hypothetical protein
MKGFFNDADKPTESSQVNSKLEVLWCVRNLGDTQGRFGET